MIFIKEARVAANQITEGGDEAVDETGGQRGAAESDKER